MNEQENEVLEREEAFLDGFDGEEPQTGAEQDQNEEPFQDAREEGDQEDAFAGADRLPQETGAMAAQAEAPVDRVVRAQVDRGLAEFAKAFPGVYDRAKADPGAIPETVWADVRAGMSLTAAYARYAVAQTARVRQGQVNAQRSTGSMRSAGGEGKGRDAFLAGFEE